MHKADCIYTHGSAWPYNVVLSQFFDVGCGEAAPLCIMAEPFCVCAAAQLLARKIGAAVTAAPVVLTPPRAVG